MKSKSTKARPAREIERKFLVTSAVPGAGPSRRRAHSIVQGYVASDTGRKVEVRVRRHGESYFLTVKQGAGEQRVEVEVPLRRNEFDALWPATEGRRIAKKRYRLP